MDRLPNFYRGDTLKISAEFTEDDGTVIDITGWIFFVTLKSDPEADDDDAELEYEVTAPANADSEAGQIILDIPYTLTAPLIPNTLYYMDIQRVIPGSPLDVATLHKQTIRVLRDITQRTAL